MQSLERLTEIVEEIRRLHLLIDMGSTSIVKYLTEYDALLLELQEYPLPQDLMETIQFMEQAVFNWKKQLQLESN